MLAIVLVVAAVTARVVIAGEQAIASSTVALRAGDPEGAVVQAREAASWYAPGAPHVRVAYARLMAIGREAEARQRTDVALLAYRSVVTASASTRWLVRPHLGDVDQATRAIARIESLGARPPALSTEPAPVMERQQLEALATDTSPSRLWVGILVASFVAWVAGLAWVLLRIDETGRLAWSAARPGLAIAVVGISGYLAALFLA
jgi:hypothetical protein